MILRYIDWAYNYDGLILNKPRNYRIKLVGLTGPTSVLASDHRIVAFLAIINVTLMGAVVMPTDTR